MVIKKGSNSYSVWLTREEENDRAVLEEITRLGQEAEVTVYVSGTEDALLVLGELIKATNSINRQ